MGVEAGVRHLVLLTKEQVENPRPPKVALRRIARLNRELARRCPGSRHREETTRKLACAPAQVAHLRRNAWHQPTTRLARTYGAIVVEPLYVGGLLRNRRLSRALADAAPAELRRQLAHKTVWHGCRLLEADPSYPSSQPCSRCGPVQDRLPLGARAFRCDACGRVPDQDENPARNLAAVVAAVAGSGPETQNARGREGRKQAPPPGGRIPEEAGKPAGRPPVSPAPPPGNGWMAGTVCYVPGNG